MHGWYLLYNIVEVQKFHNKAHSIKLKKKKKEGPIRAAIRINIRALFMFRFPAKRPLKNPVKYNERIGSGYQRFRILETYSTANVGLRQLKRGTTKFKKWRIDMSFSSTQWCSKESKSLESDNSWTKAGTSGNPEWRTIRGSGWENLQPSRNGFLLPGKNDSKERQPKAESEKWETLKEKRPEWKVSKWLLEKQH